MTEHSESYQGARVLIVDDDRFGRLILRRMLEKMGFVVDEAHDGEAALATTQRTRFDLVFTDLSMPGMDGMGFLRAARREGLTAPIVFVTATGSLQTAVEAIKQGAFDFVEKPLQVDKLGMVVHAAMASRSDGQAPGEPEAEQSGIATGPVSTTIPALAYAQRAATGPGGTIGRYRVESKIGRGGMGVVYRCMDPLIERPVAVKVLQAGTEDIVHGAETIARFRREAAAAGTLKHPGITSVYDMGKDDASGDWFIVMELLDGQGLGQYLDERGRLDEAETLSLGFQMADALAFAHGRGVVHRDIKPTNVHVSPSGVVKLLDFGLAVLEGWNVTTGGRIFGSPSYMAPERIQGEPGGPASDQFSLGVLIYEAACGINPFDGETPEARLTRVLFDQPVPLCEASAQITGDLSDLVMRMLSKDAALRHESMDGIADAMVEMGAGAGLQLRRFR